MVSSQKLKLRAVSVLTLIALVLSAILSGCATTDTTPSASAPVPSGAATRPPEYSGEAKGEAEDVTDYIYLWHRNGRSASNQHQNIYIKTGNYGLNFTASTLNFNKFLMCEGDTYDSDLKNGSAKLDAASFSASHKMAVIKNGVEYVASGSVNSFENYNLVDSGSVLQRFYMHSIPHTGLADVNEFNSRMEFNGTSEYFSIYFDVAGTKKITGLTFKYEFNTGDTTLTEQKWFNDSPDSGILTLSSADGKNAVTFVAPLLEDGVRHTLEYVSPGVVAIHSNEAVTSPARPASEAIKKRVYGTGMIIVPKLNDPAKAEHFINPIENDITATGIAPYTRDCKVSYDGLRGLYEIKLRSEKFSNTDRPYDNPTLEQVMFKIKSKYSYEPKLTFMFTHSSGQTVDVQGGVPILREVDGTPTGTMFQISKNWHISSSTSYMYDGKWQEYYCRIKAPANQELSYEYTTAFDTWGGVLTASHAQLSLIGWSSPSWLWEEAALGTHTENYCYSPNSSGGFTQDIRPILVANGVKNDNSQPEYTLSGFCDNVGGANFLCYVDANGKLVYSKDVKVQYLDHGPNLTLVKYSGVSNDDKVRFVYTVQLQRSNDLARAYHTFEYDILQPIDGAVTFSVHQFGAEDYNESAFTDFAYGNSTGLVKAFTTNELDQGSATRDYKYVTDYLPLEGETPWMFWSGTHEGHRDSMGDADRALVIRNWSSIVNGQVNNTPYLRIRSATAHHQKDMPTNIMELSAGTSSLKAGDFIYGTVELMVFPQGPDQYIGFDTHYKELVDKYAGTWNMAYQQAIGNNIQVSGLKNCELVTSHPTVLRAADGATEVGFSLTNGISYVPVSFTNLSTHKGWTLLEKVGDKWVSLSESQEVFGNDYWQCRYDPITDSYTIVYNVDRNTNSALTEYKLVLQK